MKKVTAIVDLMAFAVFGILFASSVSFIALLLAACGKRKQRRGEINELTFAIFDLISNKYSSMFEDALLNGYISKHYYVYLDFNNPDDRFENIGDRIFFYSIAAHPDSALCRSGFRKINMLLAEIKLLLRAILICIGGKVSFVKSHDPHLLGLNGLVIARLFKLPCVLHMNSDFDMKYYGTGKVANPIFGLRPIERLFEKAVIGSYDAIMADRKLYSKSRSFPKSSLKKYRAFGVRVDEKHYLDPAARCDLRGELGLEGKKILLYVGRLHPVKYPEDVLKAFGILKRRMDKTALLIVGAGVLRDALEDMAKEEGLSESVYFLGPKSYDELIDILHTADILIAPHGGMTLVEAALASTPIVAYDFDWHPEFIEEGRMGFMVPFRDFEGMAKKAEEILTDDKLRRSMGAYCRKVAISRYSRNVSIENEKQIYDNIIKS